MQNNLTDFIQISSRAAENLDAFNGTCAIETTQIVSQCNEYLALVLFIGVVLGMFACGIGVLIGSWYRGRQSINK